MKRDEITAAVLAGGQSRRFGYPKTDAMFHGRPLIDIAVQLAKHLSPRVFLMDNGMVARSIEGVESVKDFIQGCGPLGAVYTAMECSQTPWVAIVPCDMPLLDIRIYHELVKQSTRLVPIAALGPTGVEPLVSLWPRSLAVHIGERLHSGLRSVRGALHETEARCFEIDRILGYSPLWTSNANSRQELENLME